MDEAPSGPPVPPAPPPPTPMSDRAVAFEVLAVLAIGVLPHLWGSILQIVTPVPPPLPLWLDALDLSFRNGFIIVATLYVIWRSGESWRYFGIVRPGWRDLVIGFGVWLGTSI